MITKTELFTLFLLIACYNAQAAAQNPTNATNVQNVTAPLFICPLAQGSLQSISGVGVIAAQPDVATFTFYITQTGNDTNATLQNFRQMVNATLRELFDNGIAEEDVETSAFSIYPNYGFADRQTVPAGIYIYEYFTVTVRNIIQQVSQMGQQQQNQTLQNLTNLANQTNLTNLVNQTNLTNLANQTNQTNQTSGQNQTQNIGKVQSARVGDRIDLSMLLDRLVAMNGTNLFGVSFDIANRTLFENQARALAFQDSQNIAQQYADLAGMQLGNPLRISESIP
jgi:uncharacterized protein YggE